MTEAGFLSAKRISFAALSLLVGVALVVVLGRVAGVDSESVGSSLAAVDPAWVVVVVACTLVHFLITAAKWSLSVSLLERTANLRTSFFDYSALIGLLGQVLPLQLCTLAVRSMALRVHDRVAIAPSAATTVLDQVFDLTVFLAVLGPALLAVVGWISPAAALGLAAAVVSVTGLIVSLRGAECVLSMARILTRGRSVILPGRTDLTKLYALTVVRFVNLAARFVVIGLAIGSPVPWTHIVLATPVILLSFVLSVTPMGLGIAELGWVGLLTALGSTAEEATQFAIGSRILMASSVVIVNLFVVSRRWSLPRRSPAEGTTVRRGR